jgi:hypothetical protein
MATPLSAHQELAMTPSGIRVPAMWFESNTLLMTIRLSIARYQLIIPDLRHPAIVRVGSWNINQPNG